MKDKNSAEWYLSPEYLRIFYVSLQRYNYRRKCIIYQYTVFKNFIHSD